MSYSLTEAYELRDRVRAHLTEDLLAPKYRKIAPGNPPEFGHCYVAAEALFHLLGGMESSYRPQVSRDETNDTHWWLVSTITGMVVDPTANQFTEEERVHLYNTGRSCGFLTKKPSKRARILMARVVGR